MKKIVQNLPFTIVLLLCISLCQAQTTSKDLNIQKQQLTLADLITLVQSNDSGTVKSYVTAKGWRKLPFEINKQDDNAKNTYRGRLPVGFLQDELWYSNRLPSDYTKLIWGLAYAESRTSDGSVYDYSETYCYVYFSATEVSAVSFGNPVTDKAYKDRLLAQLAEAGFKATEDGGLHKVVYRNDIYELTIHKSSHYFFYNYKEFEAQKVRRKAEAERENQEQWQKMQDKIKNETRRDLTSNAVYWSGEGAEYSLQKKEFWHKRMLSSTLLFAEILSLDVYGYFGFREQSEYGYIDGTILPPYDTELKRKKFEQSEEYAQKLDTLKSVRTELLKTAFFIASGTFGSYGRWEYNLSEKGFRVEISLGHGLHKEIRCGEYSIIPTALPVLRTNLGHEYFLAAMDEDAAIELENLPLASGHALTDARAYLFFIPNGKYEKSPIGRPILYTDKVRVVIANQKTGKVYYDRSFPDNGLPLTREDRLSPAEYQAYIAEKNRIAEEKKAEEERRKRAREKYIAEMPAYIEADMVDAGKFKIGKYEVTQLQWQTIMGTGIEEHCKQTNTLLRNVGDSVPMYNISTEEALAFIKKLNEKSGKNYRLPTEGEWQFAYRGGNLSKGYQYSGSDDINETGWITWMSDFEHVKNAPVAVGTKRPNELGIYDMDGNVSELCTRASSIIGYQGTGWCRECSKAKRNAWRGFRLACDTEAGKKHKAEVLAAVESNMVLVQGGSGFVKVVMRSTLKTNKRGEWIGGHNYTTHLEKVIAPADFYIGKYEVTQAEWEVIMGTGVAEQSNRRNTNWTVRNVGDNIPMYNVSDKETLEFIEKLNEKTGKNYRLPTESEWQFAYRGGNLSKGYQYSGSNDAQEAGWVELDKESRDAPFAVGTKIPNELDIYDMDGNVSELCTAAESITGYSGNSGCSNCPVGFRLAHDADASGEIKPAFPGGQPAMWQFLKENISYPVKLHEKNMFGKVVVQFAVDTDGSVKDVKCLESFDAKFGKEMVRVLKTMPKWKPAAQDGKPVKAYYTLPITFGR